MNTQAKSTVDEIRARFDADVERFSDLDKGQVASIDSPLHMELIAEAAAATTAGAWRVLDIGCGAGNYTLKLLQRLPEAEVALIDLSRPMLDRAVERIRAANGRVADVWQGDVREIDLGEARFDVVIAAQCLHHLREETEWRDVFDRVFAALRRGGSFWISDSIEHEMVTVRQMIWRRWGEYLAARKDAVYRDHVFAYVRKEDTPRSLQFQLDLLRSVGFAAVDVLHQHGRFASFGALKAGAEQGT